MHRGKPFRPGLKGSPTKSERLSSGSVKKRLSGRIKPGIKGSPTESNKLARGAVKQRRKGGFSPGLKSFGVNKIK